MVLGALSRKERWAVGAFLSSPQEMRWGDGTWKSARKYLSAEKIMYFIIFIEFQVLSKTLRCKKKTKTKKPCIDRAPCILTFLLWGFQHWTRSTGDNYKESIEGYLRVFSKTLKVLKFMLLPSGFSPLCCLPTLHHFTLPVIPGNTCQLKFPEKPKPKIRLH